MYMVLIHSSVHEHLDCFLILTIKNYVALNIQTRDFMLTYISLALGYTLEAELLRYMVTVYLTF